MELLDLPAGQDDDQLIMSLLILKQKFQSENRQMKQHMTTYSQEILAHEYATQRAYQGQDAPESHQPDEVQAHLGQVSTHNESQEQSIDEMQQVFLPISRAELSSRMKHLSSTPPLTLSR